MKEDRMKQYRIRRGVLTFVIVAFASILAAHAQDEPTTGTAPVRMTVTMAEIGRAHV